MKKTKVLPWLYSGVLIFSVLLDQLTKWWVVKDLKPIGSHRLIDKVFQLRYVENRGAAFGMMQGQRTFFIVFSSLAITAILVALVLYRKKISPFLGLSLTMIAGGGIGNQIDRILNGYVVDFFEFLFVDFAVFNVADCFVTVGAFLVAIDLLFFDRHLLFDEKSKKNGDVPNKNDEKPKNNKETT